MSYYEPDDDGGAFEAAYDAGFWSPDDIDELREILKLVDLTPVPGNRHIAALILLNDKLNPVPYDNMVDSTGSRVDLRQDPNIVWASNLLKETT